MHEYEAHLLAGMRERTVRIPAPNETEAYRLAEGMCGEGEYVRGVNPDPVGSGWRYMTDAEDRETYGGAA